LSELSQSVGFSRKLTVPVSSCSGVPDCSPVLLLLV
jgi:hypothetical protein